MMGELYCDTRLGGIELWVYGDPRDALMRVPDRMLQCVVFVSYEDNKGQHSDEGTGFYVSVPSEADPKVGFPYLVTSKHLLDQRLSKGRRLKLRLNRRSAPAVYIDAPPAEEWVKSDKSDVVFVNFWPPEEEFELAVLKTSLCLTSEGVRDAGVGPGDQIATIGLFSERTGADHILPIVRTGTIAAMPSEPVRDDLGFEYPSYLTEARSIPGTSGAPVFLMLEYGRPRYEGDSVTAAKRGSAYMLLGVMRGHWNLIGAGRKQRFGGKEILRLNTGISLVTPIQNLLDILMTPKQEKDRREATPSPNLPVAD